jgi:small conductance mechanosensitive channel
VSDPEVLRTTAIEYLVRTLWALVVVIAAIVIARAVRGTAVRALGRHRAHPNVIVLLGNLVQLTVLLVGALAVLAIYTQGSFGWILTSFSVLGLVVGLSLQDILRNFFAGIYILVERPFRIGDTVQVGEHTGIVEEISFRTTQLRTDDGREVVVPNATLMTSPVVNLTRYSNRSATLVVTVPAREASADTPDLLREMLGRSQGIARDPAPTIRLRGSSGGQASYEVTVWGPDRDRAAADAVAAILASGAGWDVQAG